MSDKLPKRQPSDFVLLGGTALFRNPVGTSGLMRPDLQTFLAYSRKFFSAKQYTNNGPLVRELEDRLATFHQSEYCVTFCSGFWAMILAIDALKLSGRDEVIMPSLTYRRLADLVAWTGLKPRFCEVDPNTLAMTAEDAAALINDETALILGVHPIVNCCDVNGLRDLSNVTGIPLLVDSVESAYEETKYGRVGSIAHAEAFSLHASKLINGAEGGYITTSDVKLRDKLRVTRGFGLSGLKVEEKFGTNAKLNEMHAALALSSLDSLEDFVEHNQEIYHSYREAIGGLPQLRLVQFDENYRSSYKNIVIEILDDWPFSRDFTVKVLNSENILARSYYSPAVHQKAMSYPHIVANLPVTDALAKRFILMPSGFMVTKDDVNCVTSLLLAMSIHSKALCKPFKKGRL